MTNEASSQLIQILEKTVSPDKNELEAAQHYLEQAAQNNLPEFVKTLSDVLHHGGYSPGARKAAGLQLKNILTAEDYTVKTQCQQRWLAFPEEVRLYIKNNILGALGTDNNRPSLAAQCVAYVAVAELPVGQWPDLTGLLVSYVVNETSTEIMKEATLKAIDYICQDADVLISQFNSILTAILDCMRQSEPSNHVRLAATTALYNSLEFETRENFDNESERNCIMEVVCEATQSPDTGVKLAALKCLMRIVSLYYHYMESYMGPALLPTTLEAIESEVDEVASQAIHIWVIVSDKEIKFAREDSEVAEAGRPPQCTSKFYAKGALQFLVPVLMKKLTKRVDNEVDLNPRKDAELCLSFLATCCEDSIVPYIMPFVKENIKSTNWRYRDAALMAFGSILGCLENGTLVEEKSTVEEAMPTLIEILYDSSVVVQDTAAQTIRLICRIITEAPINENYVKPLLESLINGLKSEPRVAANVCRAFTGLAKAAYDAVKWNCEGARPETYCLSEYFDGIILGLLETTDRPESAQTNLRSAAYKALMNMVTNSPADCYVTVQKTTTVMLERLNQVMQMENHIQSHTDREQYNDLQILLCDTLQSALLRLTPDDAPQKSDAIMTALLQMFNSNKSGDVQDAAIKTVSTIVRVLGDGFLKYMDAFKQFICLDLKNHAEYQVCSSAVDLIRCICIVLNCKALPYMDEMMMILLENLKSNTVLHKSVKPQILSVFGDIAESIGPEFKKYLDVVLQTLVQASQSQAGFHMVFDQNELRVGIFEAYIGIVGCLKGDDATPNTDIQLLEPHLPFIIQFITMVACDIGRADSNVAACACLIGELCSAFGSKVFPLLDVEPINKLLTQGRRSRDTKTKTLATMATKVMRNLAQ